MPEKGKRFYELIAEFKESFPEEADKFEELKQIYDETKNVISKIVAGISKTVHGNYTPDLFTNEDLDNVRKIEGLKEPVIKKWAETILI